MLLDIVLLPPERTRKEIGAKIKKEVGNFPSFLVVDNVRFIPHLSLWHSRTSKSKIDIISKELQEVVKDEKPVKISSSGFIVSKNFKTCVEFRAQNNASLTSLQERVFRKIYQYKTGMMPSFIKPWTGEKLKEARYYGKPLGFGPHFTMGFLKKERDAAEVSKRMRKAKFAFVAKEVYICEVNKWWQVRKIIKKIDFGK